MPEIGRTLAGAPRRIPLRASSPNHLSTARFCERPAVQLRRPTRPELPKIFRNSSSLLFAFSMSSLGCPEYAFAMFVSTDSEKPADLKGRADPAQTSSAVRSLTRLQHQLLEKVRILEERISSLEARQPAPPLPSQTPTFSVGASSRSTTDLESPDGRQNALT